jgi:hypothetical protein
MNDSTKQIEMMSKHFLMDKHYLQQCVNSVCSTLKMSPKTVLNILGKNKRRIEMKHILIPDVLNIIESYNAPLKYKVRFPELFKELKLWVDDLKTKKEIKIFWSQLSKNTNAIDILEQNQDKIDWSYLTINPNAIKLLEANSDKIKWQFLTMNPNSIELLKKYPAKIEWYFLAYNPNAIELMDYYIKTFSKSNSKLIQKKIQDFKSNGWNGQWKDLCKNSNTIELLKQNQDKIYWGELSANPNAIELLGTNKEKINWNALSSNPNAIKLLEANKEQINWSNLSSNPNAIKLLETNKEQINWKLLSENPNAIHLLEANKDRINWEGLSMNPNGIDLIKEKLKTLPDALSLIWVNKNPDVIKLALETYLKSGKKIDLDSKSQLWANPAIFEQEKGVMSELMTNEKYYVVYNTETNKEEQTFNTLKEAQEYAIFF